MTIMEGEKSLQMQVPGKRRRGILKIRIMDGIKVDMKMAGVTIDDAGDRSKWK